LPFFASCTRDASLATCRKSCWKAYIPRRSRYIGRTWLLLLSWQTTRAPRHCASVSSKWVQKA